MKHIKQSLITGGLTFVISVLLNLSSNTVLAFSPLTTSFILLFFIILIGIGFDLIGTAATAGEEKPFHAMASNRVPGAKHGIWLVKNADRVASFSNDVIGDIAGTLSGAVAAAIVFRIAIISSTVNTHENWINTFFIGLVAALTVGGKSLGKSFAMKHATDILFLAGRVLYGLEKIGIKVMRPEKTKSRSKSKKVINNEKGD